NLLDKIKHAFAAVNEAEQTTLIAKSEFDKQSTELVSRSKALGLLLLEAKKLHPKVVDFQKYLKDVEGLGLSRAYDCIRLAGGRSTDEELRQDARERQRKSRKKRKRLPPPAATDSVTDTESTPDPKPPHEESQPEPQPDDSVTEPDVTESSEVSI